MQGIFGFDIYRWFGARWIAANVVVGVVLTPLGASNRLPPRGLAQFEAVINAVHKAAPGAAIAFNTRPDDSADAAAPALALGN